MAERSIGEEEYLSDIAELDTLVTVIDAANFLTDLKVGKDLQSAGQAATEDDIRTIADLLIDQVECANVILINKTDLVAPEDVRELEAFIEKLNPYALKMKTAFAEISPSRILSTGRFDFETIKGSTGWQVALREEPKNEADEFGICSFVYRARRPFHPQRFFDRLSQEWNNVLRSKGYFWLATRLDKVGVWSQAARVARLDVGGFWWAAIPREEWPDIPGLQDSIEKNWHPEFGDCRQELVFIGIDMDERDLRDSLDACLLTDIEMKAGPYAWQTFEDPFPAWDVQRLAADENAAP